MIRDKYVFPIKAKRERNKIENERNDYISIKTFRTI